MGNIYISIRSSITIIILLYLFVLFFIGNTVVADNSQEDIAAESDLRLFRRAAFVMGSLINISIYGESEEKIDRVVKMAFNEVKRLDMLMSNYKKDSELSRVNMNAIKGPTLCDGELLSIIEQSIYFSQITNGAFDISVYPLIDMWGFYGDGDGNIEGYIPSKKELRDILPAISYKNIVIKDFEAPIDTHGTIYFKNSKTQIDLGAFGKGYAVDRVTDILKREGIKSALVNFAGNIYALGIPQGRKNWTIGLKDPTNTRNITGSFKINNKAVATSGDYERFFVMDGKRYTHIIDPRSGRPVRSILSVTIVADTAAKADALSTGVFVLGPDEGLRLVERLNSVECIIVFEDGKSNIREMVTAGFKEMLDVDNEEATQKLQLKVPNVN